MTSVPSLGRASRLPIVRRLSSGAALLGLAFGFAVAVPGAERDFSQVQIKATHVAGTVYMLEGSGGNIGVSVGDDGVVLVDDQFAPLAPKIREALKAITDKPLKFILNTHYHFDHTGGNAPFGREATIVAHENVRSRLEKGGTVAGNNIPPAAQEALPVITFNDRASIHLNGEEMQAIHLPNGHTDGDSIIYFTQSKVVHMGDDFVTYGFPFVDVAAGGSVSGMIAGLEGALDKLPADVKVIPGHGPLSNASDVRKFVTLLKETHRLVANAVRNGQTLEQMKSERLLAKYEEFGKGFIKTEDWLKLLYTEVTQKKTSQYLNHGHQGER